MTAWESKIEFLLTALLLAPFKPDEWMNALELLAAATSSSHGQLVGWNAPNRVPFKMISNVSDQQAQLIRQWEMEEGANPTRNPLIERGVRTRVLEIVSDDEIVSLDDRKRHRVWREFYDKVDMPHLCYTSLWQEGVQAQLGLIVLRSTRDGPIQPDQRRVFTASAKAWCRAAALSRAIKNEGARVLAGAFQALSVSALVLDGFGKCIDLSATGEASTENGELVRLRAGRVELRPGLVARADCAVVKRVVSVDSQLQPCVDCVVKSGLTRRAVPKQACSIQIKGAGGYSAALQLSPLPRPVYDIGFIPAAMIIIEATESRSQVDLDPEIAGVLTSAERSVALELLNGKRPAAIAALRGVSIETVRAQIRNIYIKAGVSGSVEFASKARRR